MSHFSELGYIRVLIDENVLQFMDFERFPFDWMGPSDRKTLSASLLKHVREKLIDFSALSTIEYIRCLSNENMFRSIDFEHFPTGETPSSDLIDSSDRKDTQNQWARA